mmetsp:Transcript_32169/g.37806  ORF Transcript_32169/g.37806 Transcript_32169/m.37806 type:complete len:418 (+) Transcript_32169:67-1320(+)
MASNSKSAIAKSLLAVAVPSIVAGYLWWQSSEQNGRAEEQSETPKEQQTTENNIQNEDENEELKKAVPNNNINKNGDIMDNDSPPLFQEMRNICGKTSIIHVEVKQAAKGRGRGLFIQKDILKNDCFLHVRPSLVLLFEPYCHTHCIGCFANLHQVPGRQCEKCNRFAVCQDCDLTYGLYDWHASGECIRWNKLPQNVTRNQKLDVLWLLVRYRSALHQDIDYTDITTNDHSTSQGENSVTSLEKEPLQVLQFLQANDIDIPQQQLMAFSQLTDLDITTVKKLILQLRTNAGSIIDSNNNKIGMALSAHLGFFNHSCQPNSIAKVSSGFLEVKALNHLSKGEEVTICYVDETLSVNERQTILKGHYQFHCKCQRCKTEIQRQSTMSPQSLSDSVEEWEKVEQELPSPEDITKEEETN